MINVLVVMVDVVEVVVYLWVEIDLKGIGDLFCVELVSGLFFGLVLGVVMQVVVQCVLEVMNWIVVQGCDELILLLLE